MAYSILVYAPIMYYISDNKIYMVNRLRNIQSKSKLLHCLWEHEMSKIIYKIKPIFWIFVRNDIIMFYSEYSIIEFII